MDELQRAAPGSISAAQRFPIFIILDDVRSMNNVGSIFRTADAFNAAGIYLCGYTPRPPHRDIQKTALGATETVPWQYVPTVAEAIQHLKIQGYRIWALEQVHHSSTLGKTDFKQGEKIALVFGNEVAGVSNEALALCDGCLEIPQWGSKHSLNISVTVGVALWELVRSLNG
ncbi:MAG: RNA methyltransferase [Edaphocola sp.]